MSARKRAELHQLLAERSVAQRRGERVAGEGSRRKVEKLAISSPTASATACCRPPRAMSVSDGSSWFVLMREYTAAAAVHVLRALRERQPSHSRHRSPEYGQSNLFERIGRGTFLDAADRVDQLPEASKSTTTTWCTVGSAAPDRLDRGAGPPNWFAALIFPVP